MLRRLFLVFVHKTVQMWFLCDFFVQWRDFAFFFKIGTGKLLDLVGMIKSYVLSNFYASRTQTRPVARHNEVRKRVF